MNKTAIEWTDYTWNPATGCTPVSEGCRNCWARRMAQRLRGRFGYPADEPFRVTLHPERLREPFYQKGGKRIFVCSMGDLFHPDVPDDFLDEVFFPMYVLNVDQVFIVLTKRPERMRDYLSRKPPLPPTVWLGVTCENQATADERIPLLLQTPAAVRWVSCEPLLGPVDLRPWLCTVKCTRCGWHGNEADLDCTDDDCGDDCCPECKSIDLMDADMHDDKLDWVVCGGETGPGARPMHPDWARSLRDQCQAAGVAFLFKGWGSLMPCGYQDKWFGAPYEDGVCIDGFMWDLDSCDEPGGPLYVGGEDICPRCKGSGYVRIKRDDPERRLLDGRTWDEYPEVRA